MAKRYMLKLKISRNNSLITKQKLTPADVIAKLKESCPIPKRLSKEYKQS